MTRGERKDLAPSNWNEHWDNMPNSVRALYATFRSMRFPWCTKEVRIEAWGQLCFDAAAANAVAYHMYNNEMRTGWKFLSWRCEMSGAPVGGGKLNGVAPLNFDISDYVHC